MKSCVVFILAIGAVSSLGSGPYLPSGWRPKGPAFVLPTEVKDEKPQGEESEAFGSDALREYRPPAVQDIYQAVTIQALPDLYTEKAFAEENKANEEETVSVLQNVDVGLRSNVFESVDAEMETFKPTEAGTTEVTEENKFTIFVIEEEVKELNFHKSAGDIGVTDSITPGILDETTENAEVQITDQNFLSGDESSKLFTNNGLRINGEDNVSYQDKQVLEKGSGFKVAERVEIQTVGFREYGPPDVQIDEKKLESAKIDANENRKRRFSLKFTTAKKH